VQPYWQRTVYEVCPELSLHQLNDNQPMTSRKRSAAGQEERRALLLKRFPGSERILDAETIGAGPYHRTDACAALWTARRLIARAVIRLGPRSVVVTGGHRLQAADVFHDGRVMVDIPGERHRDGAAHGSGCTHSAVLAAQLALGQTPLRAARVARRMAGEAVGRGLRDVGEGPGPVDVLGLGSLRR